MLNDLIFDVGLHKGEDSAYYLARGFRVVAIEADPDLVEYCKSKFKNEIDSKQLSIIHGAVVEDDDLDSVMFYKNKKVSVWGTVVKKWADRNSMLGADSVAINVPVVNFSELFLEYDCPYYLKIDIEGMDLVCLRKLLKTDCRPNYISIESDKVVFDVLKQEFDTFTELGYRGFFIQQQYNIQERSVPLQSTEGVYLDYEFERGSTGPFGSDLEGSWLSEKDALARYRKIFKEYRWFGDNSLIRRAPLGRFALAALSKVLRRPLPGWYDTHARLG